jgi:hypothetical protein
MLHHETTFVHSISALLGLGFTGTILVLRDALGRRVDRGRDAEIGQEDASESVTAGDLSSRTASHRRSSLF